ncbi:hypothetical protein B0J11DRAFT_152762 [Dendryphion nanum]|uniref:Glycosyl transferase CAP10 domain-containing protein n=1 Tax=Dendryphion nanum TaxID=256645 RepID=A0A9P9IWR7_9PLEO|nr:hypothetical protein B0J11DRAFT_152762 [Dendryphion nanum]
MHPAIHLIGENAVKIAQNAVKYQHLLLPLLFAILGPIATAHTPTRHSLLVHAVSWALIWIPTLFRTGFWSEDASRSRKITSWLAGACIALAQICDRAASDKEGVWSNKGFLPLLVVLFSDSGILANHPGLPLHYAEDPLVDSPSSLDKGSHSSSSRFLVVATVSALTALATRYKSPSTFALGISSVIFTAAGLVLLETALKSSKDDTDTNKRGFMSANGTLSRRQSFHAANKDQQLASLRDVAVVVMIACGMTSYMIEPAINPRALSWTPVYEHMWGNWQPKEYQITVEECLFTMVATAITNMASYFMLSQQGAVHTSFFYLFAFVCARLNFAVSFSGIWFSIVFVSSSLLFLSKFSTTASIADVRASIRTRRIVFAISVFSFALASFRYVTTSRGVAPGIKKDSSFDIFSPDTPFSPIPVDMTKGHPAEQLMRTAEKEFSDMLSRQSKSLPEAVHEYRRRYGIAPPPMFDKWYEFATRNGVQLIDEFDTISHALLPFWALKPSTIRSRVRLALANYDENALVAIMVRDGHIVKVENGDEWQHKATLGMMKEFVQYLPDMDLAFNIHDEPRVVVPHDELSILVAKAQGESIPAAIRTKEVRNSFSSRPPDLSDGRHFDEASNSHFNRFAHQQTWTHSRLSCSPKSQARNYEDQATDNLTSYAAGPLNYVYNYTAFSDICNSPSLASRFGFFERPNAFNIIHELTPIFSQSKLSSFQDILYPSPWYWFGKVGYDAYRDTSWTNKTNSLYWRGSTTGGFSRNGGWRRQHRQYIVKRLNAADNAKVLVNKGTPTSPEYTVHDVERRDLANFVDVTFSHVGQCDPGDCKAQEEFFRVVERVDGQDAWYYKHLLDMDGNAFSGRFYTFLKSNSLTYKMAMFREWHQEWLKPWVHYIPLSLIGDEHLDLVRWFGGGENQVSAPEGSDAGQTDDNKGGNGESIGEKKAREIAERSTEWAGKALRNVDFEVWFFRLLLEYGRVVDDHRDSIGYTGP